MISRFFAASIVLTFAILPIMQAQEDSVVRSISEVVVTGTRVPVPRDVMPVPVTVVGRETIERSDATALLPALMQHVPGLFVTSRGMAGYGVSGGAAGGINMRGFSGGAGQILVLIDGHPQYAPIYGHHVADAYMASDAQHVEVSRGAASVLYGSNAMGGTINIITRRAVKDGNSLTARAMAGSYGTRRYTLTDTYRKGKFSGAVSGNYEGTNGHRDRMAFDSWTVSAKAGYELSAAWKVTVNVNAAKAKAEVAGPADNPVIDGTTDVLRGMSGLSIENLYGKTRGTVNFYYNWGDHQINDGYPEGGAPQPYLFNSTDYMGGVNIYQAVNLFEGNTLTGGFDVKMYGGNAFRDPQTEVYADHVTLNEVAGYMLLQQKIWKLMFETGVRIENHELYGAEWVPQAGVSFRPAAATSLKFSVSKGFRTPNMRELYMYAPANEELKPERNVSCDFTVSQRLLDNRLSAELTLYYIRGDNMVEVVPTGAAPPVQNRNTGEFANRGAEFSFDFRILKNLSVNANYSFLDMEKAIAGAPKSKFYAGAVWRPGKFALDGGIQAIGDLYLVTGETPRTADWTTVDLRLGYRPVRWLEVFVKGDNLLDKTYETMVGYPMPGITLMGGISVMFH